MKAIVIPRHGRADVLEVRDVAEPRLEPGHVRIAVRAAGLNFSEVSARQGLYPDMPRLPAVVGYEVAGTIDALGEGVTGLSVGQHVWAICHFGGHAEVVCTPAALVRPMPAGLDFVAAAAVPVAYATAMLLTHVIGNVRPGDSVLVHMAAGGVGLASIQLARLVPDVTLIATASASKHAFLKAQGVEQSIDYRACDFEAEVRRRTDGRGVGLILDPMGGRHWRKNYRLLAPLGRLILFGFANATAPGKRNLVRVLSEMVRAPHWSPMQLMNDNRAVMGLNLGRLMGETDLIRRGLDDVSRLLGAGQIRPTVDDVFSFGHAARAHRRIEERRNVGKVVLVPTA
ncbi:MAG: synaptic vesicle VAT-1 family membrane protein [Polyangiaceae bacterium]